MTRVPIFLSDEELERCKRIADVRNSKCGEVPNYRETRKHSDWQIHYDGARGEVAVCKRYNFPVDEHFSYGGDDGKADLYIKGWSCEVKTATYDPPIVKLNSLCDLKSDMLILALVQHGKKEAVVHLCGAVTKNEFIRCHTVRDFGYGPRACMEESQLVSIEAFEKAIQYSPPAYLQGATIESFGKSLSSPLIPDAVS